MTKKQKSILNWFYCEGRTAHYKNIPFAGIFLMPCYCRMSKDAQQAFEKGYRERQAATGVHP